MLERLRLALMATALALACGAVPARDAVPGSDDPALEARVMAVAEELRCLVCQNETIAASQADLAVDLRKQIRVKLRAGQSQQEILDFMSARYGDFVLYRPRLSASTLLLWLGPFALLLIAAGVLAFNIRRRRRAAVVPAWSEEQAQRARAMLLEADAGEPAQSADRSTKASL
ncbi:MAG: cytochrome c-type biogenesis protein CcmH [Burkholderiaceae bacterium]